MILYFCNINDVSLGEYFESPEKTDIIDALLNLYEYGLCLNKKMDKDIVKKLLVQIIYISELLDFDLNDLEQETMRKSLIIQKRLNSDY